MSRELADNDKAVNISKFNCVRTSKGTKIEQRVRCGLVAQELVYDSKEGELFTGTPFWTGVKLIFAKMVSNRQNDMEFMVLDVKWSCLYGKMKKTCLH